MESPNQRGGGLIREGGLIERGGTRAFTIITDVRPWISRIVLIFGLIMTIIDL